MGDRFMRVMVFFDLPVSTKQKRKDYAHFRKNLINDGFMMLQYSVYCRLARNSDDVNLHMKRVESFLTPCGSVRAMIVTERQYAQMRLLIGEKLKDEAFLDSKDLLEL